jgi:hypothetical protein
VVRPFVLSMGSGGRAGGRKVLIARQSLVDSPCAHARARARDVLAVPVVPEKTDSPPPPPPPTSSVLAAEATPAAGAQRRRRRQHQQGQGQEAQAQFGGPQR